MPRRQPLADTRRHALAALIEQFGASETARAFDLARGTVERAAAGQGLQLSTRRSIEASIDELTEAMK